LTHSDIWSLVMVIGDPFSRCNRHVCHLQQVWWNAYSFIWNRL